MSGSLQIIIPPLLRKLAGWSIRSGSFSAPVGDAPVIFPAGMHDVELIAGYHAANSRGEAVLRFRVCIMENEVTAVRLPFDLPLS